MTPLRATGIAPLPARQWRSLRTVLLSATAMAGSLNAVPAMADLIIDNASETVIGTGGGTLPSPVIVDEYFVVGAQGWGELNVTEGGRVDVFGIAFLGSAPESYGTVLVSGDGSYLSATDWLVVGDRGDGHMTVADGGQAEASNIVIGAVNFGELLVTGENSVVGTGTMYLGYDSGDPYGGFASVSIADGARLYTAETEFLDSGFAQVVVTGAGSTWTNEGAVQNRIDVGNYSGATAARIVVKDGGLFTSDTVGLGTTYLTAATGGTIAAREIFLTLDSQLIIGAAPGETAVAAGSVEAFTVFIGEDSGIIFNHTDQDYEFLASRLFGYGTIEAYSGNTSLTGNYSGFSGTATVHGGTLSVNSTFTNDISVASGATLGGSGTIGSVTLASGATVAPGNSIGTLIAAGDFGFSAGSIYSVEVDDAGNSDLLYATGAVTIDNSATVTVTPENGTDDGSTYAPSTIYTIITADGGVTGTFGSLSDSFAFLDPVLTYDANNVYLSLDLNSVDMTAIASTLNQQSTAGGIDALGSGNSVYDAVILQTEDGARAAFDALSGEIHASARGALMEDSRFVRDAAGDVIRGRFAGVAATNEGGEADAWGRAYGAWGQKDADGNAASFERRLGGVFFGADTDLSDDWRAGLVAGYGRTGFSAGDRASSGIADSYHLGAYAGTQVDNFGIRLGAAYALHQLDTTRDADFSGFSETLAAQYNASTAQLFADVGYEFEMDGVRFEPFANLALVRHHTDGFTETGGSAALTAAASTQLAGFTVLGMRAETQIAPIGDLPARLHGSVGWRHAYGDTAAGMELAFGGGSPFSVIGAPVGADAALIETGLDLKISDGANFGLTYNGEIGSGFQDHNISGTFKVRF